MKNINLLFGIFFLSILAGCMEDEGNYDYADLQEPQWKSDGTILIYCKDGGVAKFRGHDYFSWNTDSAVREQGVSFEWKLNGVVLGTEADFDMPVSELIRKINLTKLHTDAENEVGTFSVIDKQTKAAFMKKFLLNVRSARSMGDWMVLSENGGNSKLSYISRSLNETGQKYLYELEDNAYETVNGAVLPGKPLDLHYSYEAQHIAPIGSATVMTETGAYEISGESLLKVGEIGEQFAGGKPAGLKVVARTDAWENGKNAYSYLASEDGRIYQRKMSRNNLGGRFLSEPAVIDNKGYEIHDFGVRWRGYRNIPCYDEKNRRVILIHFNEKWTDNGTPDNYDDDYYFANSQFTPVKESGIGGGGGGGFPFPPFGTAAVEKTDFPGGLPDFPGGGGGTSDYQGPSAWAMPEGTEVLHLASIGSGGFFSIVYYYALIYNDAAGNTTLGIFGVGGSTFECQQAHQSFGADIKFSSRIVDFPNLKKGENCILTNSVFSGRGEEDVCYYILYSAGNEVHLVNIAEDYKNTTLLADFGEKITCMSFTYNNDKRTRLLVGGENGKLVLYNIADRKTAEVIQDFGSVGGKVVALKEVGGDINTDAY